MDQDLQGALITLPFAQSTQSPSHAIAAASLCAHLSSMSPRLTMNASGAAGMTLCQEPAV